MRDIELMNVLRERHRSAAVAQSGEVDAVTELYRRRVLGDRTRGVNPRDAGETAGREAAAALRTPRHRGRAGITVEDHLRFVLEVAGVKVRRKRPKPQPPAEPDQISDPDEPPPF